jgi:hypothetical protein
MGGIWGTCFVILLEASFKTTLWRARIFTLRENDRYVSLLWEGFGKIEKYFCQSCGWWGGAARAFLLF